MTIATATITLSRVHSHVTTQALVVIANTHSTGAVQNLVDDLHEKHDFQISAVGVNDARKNLVDRLSTSEDGGKIISDKLELQNVAGDIAKVYCKPEPSNCPFFNYSTLLF